MKRIVVPALCGVSLLLLGCSTIVKGTTQQVAVATPGVQGAMCELSSPAIGIQTVQTPANVTLAKSKHNVAVRCQAQCYQEGVGMIASELEPMAAGNILVGGVIGIGIDAASGAMNKYAPAINVAMTPIPNCGRPNQRREVPMARSGVPQQG